MLNVIMIGVLALGISIPLLRLNEDFFPQCAQPVAAAQAKPQSSLGAADKVLFDKLSAATVLEIADLVKMDVRALDRSALRDHMRLLRNFRGKVLAEKVETVDEFAHCRELGFDLYQGERFAAPEIVSVDLVQDLPWASSGRQLAA